MVNQKRTIEGSQRFVFASDTLFQTLEEESIIVNLKTENIFGLNETGSVIASYISEEMSYGEMIEALFNKYMVSTEEVERETTEILSNLINHGLILKK